MTYRPDLTDDEIDALCAGLRQNAAKVRYLVQMGLHVERRPNGRPMVMRGHAEQVLAGLRPAANDTPASQHHQPALTGNRAALALLFGRKAA